MKRRGELVHEVKPAPLKLFLRGGIIQHSAGALRPAWESVADPGGVLWVLKNPPVLPLLVATLTLLEA